MTILICICLIVGEFEHPVWVPRYTISFPQVAGAFSRSGVRMQAGLPCELGWLCLQLRSLLCVRLLSPWSGIARNQPLIMN